MHCLDSLDQEFGNRWRNCYCWEGVEWTLNCHCMTESSTYGLCQSNHHFLAGGCLSDPADYPLDSIHPDFELHVGSKTRGMVAVCWPQHYWRLQWRRAAEAPLATSLKRKHKEKQEAVSQDVLMATIINASRLKRLSPNRHTAPHVVIPTKTSSQICRNTHK